MSLNNLCKILFTILIFNLQFLDHCELNPSIMSCFSGSIEEIPYIGIDNFDCRTKKAYFLSHAHKNRWQGLYSRAYLQEIIDNAGKIYMTEETKRVMECFVWECRTNIIELMMVTLKTGTVYTIDIPDGQSFEVTLIPVKHMAGAVMFLFKTNEKTVLFTGHFVVDSHEQLQQLHNSGIPLAIDTIYVDATFNSDIYKHFPSRQSCLDEAIDKINEWLIKGGDHGVALHHAYPMGYEDLHKTIFERTGIKLHWAEVAFRELYKDLYGDDNSPLTSEASRIHICKYNSDLYQPCCFTSVQRCYEYKVVVPKLRFLYIYVSAKSGCYYEPDDPAMIRISKRSERDEDYYLCYTTHCSKTQLEKFENFFQSTKVVRCPETPANPSAYTICPYRDKRERERMDIFCLLPFALSLEH